MFIFDINSYVYARIASLKAMADQVATKFQENLKHLELFMNREHVPMILKKTAIDYWKYQWKRTGGWSVRFEMGWVGNYNFLNSVPSH